MPQMSPLNWKFNLILFNILLFIIFNIFFSFLLFKKHFISFNFISTLSLNWKW